LAGKTSKINDKLKTHKQHMVEVLGCPCEHPTVIKFLNIHSKITMEIYAFKWNKAHFEKCWITTLNNQMLLQQWGLSMDWQT